MELYFFANGIKNQMDLFEGHMQAQYFNWMRRNLKTNQMEATSVQGALRPIQLYKYVFPEESLPDVISNMRLDLQSPPQFLLNYSWAMRKLLKLQEVPKLDIRKELYQTRPLNVPGIAVIPIGIKYEPKRIMEPLGYEQEPL